MLEKLSKNLVLLKQEFTQIYDGHSHIQEILPISSSDSFPIIDKHLELLHDFAKKNPIYHNFYEQKIQDILCRVCEGDINEHWLNSIKHGSSCQPFYPTWILSAYIAVFIAKNFGCKELVDIGSGDGRIAYCAKILDLKATSIEIDAGLVELQNVISHATNVDFNPTCVDAIEFDYNSLKLKSPVFFIGGLPQMGGDILATNVIEKISTSNIKKNACIVFAGTHSKRQLSGDQSDGGWSTLIEKHGLKVIESVSLPTIWTFDQPIDTPYIFTNFA
ncbi:hypothetical protein [Candidatus Nitrosarchaeum limnium]|jgi:hypothetical protein|uniref:DOT1 domain-containing protein n=1 Tax=Candidatus Nitrosarchaeum limnium BG20 TaxID=859192 RepID=S2EQ90_9ARCH|nr:hypothetical protein [Candidatus Nitrosarchaeum limnium]EPA04639.1 hypothetical protein BG20_I0950 [Candidatus Nitrosarchaeum limnium BG20]